MVALAVSSAPAWAGRQRTSTTARPCAARAKKDLDATSVTRRSLGVRIARGCAVALLSVGAGAAIETAVKPEVSANAAERLQDNPQETIAEAKELLRQAEADLAAGEYSAAISGFTAVIAAAPTQYTLCMKSLLGRRDALLAVGDREAAARDNRREFAWGRGVRWPGWYIIGAITFRNEIVRKLPGQQ